MIRFNEGGFRINKVFKEKYFVVHYTLGAISLEINYSIVWVYNKGDVSSWLTQQKIKGTPFENLELCSYYHLPFLIIMEIWKHNDISKLKSRYDYSLVYQIFEDLYRTEVNYANNDKNFWFSYNHIKLWCSLLK